MIISKITQFIIDQLKLNELVNTITVVPTQNIDLNKTNIYPLVNVDLTDSTYQDSIHYLNYTLTILAQRDTKPKQELENKELYSNYMDNLDETFYIATKLINRLESYYNEADIELVRTGQIRYINKDYSNLLDGVTFTITLGVVDDTGC